MMPRSLTDLVIREVPKNLLHLPARDLAEAALHEVGEEPDLP
jgi:hypothetical protein